MTRTITDESPASPDRSRGIEVAGVFDIETAEWDRFLVGETLSDTGEAFQSWSEDTFAEHLLAQRGVWYAHAGGRFDCLWLLDWCARKRRPWSARLRGSGVLSASFGSGEERLEVRDSYAVVPMALAKCAPIGGAQKVGLGLPCECGEDCGGYCALARDLSPREMRCVEEYLHADCLALAAMLAGLREYADARDIVLGLTVGGSAWRTAKTWLDLPSSEHDLGRYTSLRHGYYGGKTEVYRTHAPAGERYDIHSSYPAALSRVLLPEGEGRRYSGQLAGRHYRSGLPGIYTADVLVPESHTPPLPVRTPERLLYPHGETKGTWTAVEIAHAEACGAKVTRIRSGFAWASAGPVLAPFADRVWALRDEQARAGEAGDARAKALAAWLKWLANSLTGKLAQRPEHESLRFLPALGPGIPPAVDDGETVLRVTSDGVYVTRETVRVDACAHVQWSAYLTAEARCELHRQQQHACETFGDSGLLYSDTDSVYAVGRLVRNVGPNLGEWGHEGAANDWRCLAPKVYRYTDEKGEVIVRGKGLSGLDPEGYDALSRGGSWHVAHGVRGLRTSLRTADDERLFKRKSLSRALSPVPGWVGGRVLNADGGTRAPTVAEYEARDEG